MFNFLVGPLRREEAAAVHVAVPRRRHKEAAVRAAHRGEERARQVFSDERKGGLVDDMSVEAAGDVALGESGALQQR